MFWGSGGRNDLGFETLTEMLVECWIPGDKYGIVQSQDLIMSELLEILACTIVARKGVFAAAFHANPESRIYELMAEAMSYRITGGPFHPHGKPHGD